MSTLPKIPAHPPGQAASAWVERWAALLRPGALVLDFAGGSGRNAAPLLQAGARVCVADLDAGALALADPRAERVRVDLEHSSWPFERGRYDAVVCCNYLFRPRLDLLFGLVAPGGLLLYETFARGNARYGRPSNPAFLLGEGELFRAAERNGFAVLGYEHGFAAGPRPAMVQRLCAARPPFDAERYPVVG
jgi:hypothetical protein